MKKSALISVSDKTDIHTFSQTLINDFGFDIISTGGTAKHLHNYDIATSEVSDITKFNEILDGRVKTLHPLIHGGILAQRHKKQDCKTMLTHGLPDIRIVCVNLYPFSETVAKGGSLEQAIDNIDIGGVALIRAAAKNHPHITIATRPEHYNAIIDDLRQSQNADISDSLRRQLACEAFACTASYDTAIAHYFAHHPDYSMEDKDSLPSFFMVGGYKNTHLRYGENPHQKAALYTRHYNDNHLPYGAKLVQGKALSYNNLQDVHAALHLIAPFDAHTHAAVGIIKHANPCGCAISQIDLTDAYIKAYHADSISAFGGIIALNRPLDMKTTTEILHTFTEVIIAPSLSPESRDLLSQKPNIRVLTIDNIKATLSHVMHVSILDKNTLLVQEHDPLIAPSAITLNKVTGKNVSQQQYDDLLFAWHIVKHVKSNAIVVACNGQTLGIGAGQMNRIDSLKIALDKAREKLHPSQNTPHTHECVVASDAFFPFDDAIKLMHDYGIKAVIQPGGSVRDTQIIESAETHDITMYFTGHRHFKH